MIEVRELTKSYGPIPAVQSLSFSVKKGEVVGFLGPNGAGKSTTMKIITGSMAPTQGQVRVAGFDVFEDPIEVKKRIGYLPENPPVYGDMSVESYLQFVARLKAVPKERLRQQVERSIEKTDLGSVRHRLIQNLSKGYRQRVGIAQALVSDPELLILDEPTSGLDPRQVAEVRALIKELRGEHTIVLSTHILPEVQAMCERIIIINKGKIVAQDSLVGLAAKMQGSASVHLTVARNSAGLTQQLRGLAGVQDVVSAGLKIDVALNANLASQDSLIEQIAEAAVASKAGLLELKRESIDLEEVFLKLTTNEENQVAGGVA